MIESFAITDIDNLETIRAKASFVLFDDAGSDYSVVKYTLEEGKRLVNGKNHFVAYGNALPKSLDVFVDLHGEWVFNNKYNQNQFKVAYAEIPLPTSKKEATAYIRSLHCGIGRLKANKIYNTFGESIWDVIENSPERLTEVPGITEKTVEALIDKMNASKVQWALMKLFRGKLDVTPEKIKKLRDYYKDATYEIATREPYKLCRVSGFSFPAVDKYALLYGFEYNCEERFFAAIPYIFDMYAARGHVCVPKDEVVRALVSMLNKQQNEGKINEEDAKEKLNKACQLGFVFASNGFLYSKGRFVQENDIVSRIRDITFRPAELLSNTTVDQYIEEFEYQNKMELAENQKNAIRMVFQNKVSIITGGPGTGKSTITKAILHVYENAYGNRRDMEEPVLLAPTGRAARRLSEVTLHPASTIHSAVQYNGFDNNMEMFQPEDIDGTLFIVDEASMMDQFICAALLNAVPDDARLVFVGDPDQLPSVGCGNILQDMINSKAIPVCKLDVIYRQAQGNPIIMNSHKVNTGDTNLELNQKGFKMLERETEYDVFTTALNMYVKSVRAYGIDNVVLLNPCRSPKYQLTVGAFNKNLQAYLNPEKPGVMSMKAGDSTFRPGDRVMQMKNTDFAKNGDVGIIHDILRHPDPDNFERWVYVAQIEFNGDGQVMEYTKDDMKNVDLAYCTSIHKSQGSQYDTVIMIVSEEHSFMLRRNLIYTGITRAQNNVAIIGQKRSLDHAIQDNRRDKRWTLLQYRLADALSKHEI